MCLPNDPKYDKYTNSWETTGAIYGTEYEVSSFNPFTNNLHNHDAPCAVCIVRSRGSQLMMPARNDCPSGWAKEYHGYLMTAHYGHQSTRDFICVDWEAEYVPGSQSDKDGAVSCSRRLWLVTMPSIRLWKRADMRCVYEVSTGKEFWFS